jgi:ectoine hydroxylase-related dioxygenase (phytanoyl-CoA dioxygenase family)
MDADCLQHALTEAERLEFERHGLLVLPAVLEPGRVSGLEEAFDRIDGQVRPERGVGPHERMTVRDILWRDDRYLELVDHPTTLPKVWGILGWNIQIYHSVQACSPVEPPENRQERILGWHQDSGRLNAEMESHPRPRLSIKVAFFLSDCSQPGRANLWAIPGSHLRDDYEIPADGSLPEGAEPILVPAGGAVIFDRRIWHGPTTNASDVARKVLFYGYSYRWLRPRDDQSVNDLLPRCDPIRRQLLGDSANGGFGYSSPTDEDVPLRVWLREHLGEEALSP